MNSHYEFSDFWYNFIENYWEKKPFVFSNIFDEPFITEDALFNAMLGSARYWKETNIRTFSMWVNNKLVENHESYLPLKSDTTLLNYIDRITSRPVIKEFTYSQYNIQVHAPEIWLRARNFVNQLIKIIGVPTDCVDVDTFLGRYKYTPRGIHTDQSSTFMYVVHGHKKMIVWPPDFFDKMEVEIVGTDLRKTIINFDYREILNQGTILEGNPGDILYWPSTYWHLSEYDDPKNFAAIVNIGVFFGEKEFSLMYPLLKQAINSSLKEFQNVHSYPAYKNFSEDQSSAPKTELDALQQFRGIINSPYIEKLLKKKWLKRVSAFGFRDVPPQLPKKKLSDGIFVATDANYPIYWCEEEKVITIFANGHSFNTPHDPNLIRLLQCLNNGNEVSVGSLKKRFFPSNEFPKKKMLVQEVLEKLYSARAIELK